MPRILVIFSFFVFTVACGSGSVGLGANSQLIDYQVDNTTYAVVVPSNEMTLAEAKRLARQRAAQVTVDKGYRYFSIKEEGEVQIVQASQSENFPSNLYYDLIIQNNTQSKAPGPPKQSTAYRLVFMLEPESGSIDACTLTQCD